MVRLCVYCQSELIKWGYQNNHKQRYKCTNIRCDRTQNEDIWTMFYNKKLSKKDIKESVKMFLRGFPISSIADVKEVHEQTMRNLLREAVDKFDKFEVYKINYKDYKPPIIEVDELYLKIQGSSDHYAWIAYDPVNKIIIDYEIGLRDSETLENLFKRIKRYKTSVELILVDGFNGYEKLIVKYFGKKRFKPLVGVINKSHYDEDNKCFQTYCLFGRNRIEAEIILHKFGIGEKISTALIERQNRSFRDSLKYLCRRTARLARGFNWLKKGMSAFKIFHNAIKPHWALSERSSKNWIVNPVTPFMNANLSPLLTILDVLSLPTLD